jgi:Uma2 family endonuclease
MTAALQLPSLLDEKQDWTVDDLASLPEDLRYELIDGRLILPSPTYFHQEICAELRDMLRINCPPGYGPTFDVSLEVDRRNEPRPDVLVVRKAHGFRTPVPVKSALLVVEVISPTSHFRDMFAKLKVYAASGVGTYLVVDPTFEGGVMLTEYRLAADGHYDAIVSTNRLFKTDVPYAITIDVPALTELRNEFRQAQDDQ